MEKGIWIREAKQSDIFELCEIWKQCFQDEEIYSKEFFSYCELEKERLNRDFFVRAAELQPLNEHKVFQNQSKRPKVFVLCKEGIILSMLTSLPCIFVQGGRERPASYLYAVATRPEFQGYGYGSFLLSQVVEREKERERLPFLVPADQRLQKFYKDRGFYPFAWQNVFTIPAIKSLEKKNLEFWNLSAKEYKELRDNAFYREGYLKWEEDAIGYRIREAQIAGAWMKKIYLFGKPYVFYAQKREKTLLLLENTFPKEQLLNLASEIAREYKCNQIKLYLPCYSDFGKKELLAMSAEKVEISDIYANLLLNK